MLTNKDYCDYETSALLYELGYDCQVIHLIAEKITLYEAQKWLREEKGIFVDVGLFNNGIFYYCIRQKENAYWREIYRSFFPDGSFDNYNKFESYEKALSKGINEAVKILKNGNNS